MTVTKSVAVTKTGAYALPEALSTSVNAQRIRFIIANVVRLKGVTVVRDSEIGAGVRNIYVMRKEHVRT